jgi:hypothetical protein
MDNLIWGLVGLGAILITRRQMRRPGYSARRNRADFAFVLVLLLAGLLIVVVIAGAPK